MSLSIDQLIATNEPPAEWDVRLLQGTSGSLLLYHSTPWAIRIHELLGFTPTYFTLKENEKPHLMLIGFTTPTAQGKWAGIRRFKNRLKGIRGCFSWYGQPVQLPGCNKSSWSALAKELTGFAKEKGFLITGGEWPITLSDTLENGWKSKKWATLKINLSSDVETLTKNLDRAARKEVRKAQEKGIVIHRVATIQEMEEYGRFAEECARRYGKGNVSKKDYLFCWNFLRSSTIIFETFAAFFNEKCIAGLSIWGTHSSVMELGSYQTEECFKEKLPGPDLLKWTIIEWAKSQGIKLYDLAGINPENPTQKEINIRRFKEKWGGEYSEYLLVQNP